MDRQDSLRKWIFSALLVAAGVLLSPLFSFPLGVTRAFPLQHMINIFLAVLCGTRFSTSAAFGTALIRNILGTGSLLAFPGSMIGAFLSGYLYSKTQKLWCAVLGEFVGTSIIGGLVSYPIAAGNGEEGHIEERTLRRTHEKSGNRIGNQAADNRSPDEFTKHSAPELLRHRFLCFKKC